jgi:hypothetical protein
VAYFPSKTEWTVPSGASGSSPVWVYNVKTVDTVQLKVVCQARLIGFFHVDEPLVGWDGAYLKSGRGEIYLPSNQLGPFEEGEVVKLFARTGYTSANKWVVKIYPPPGRTDLVQSGTIISNLADDTQTYVSWTVPVGAFKAQTGDPLMNQWRAELWNDYFDVGFEQLFTIDQHERAPLISSIDAINNGGSFTYILNCNRTYAELSTVVVYAWYGYGGTTMPSTSDGESWIFNGKPFPVTNNIATFTVTPKNVDGTIIVKAILVDVEGRTSMPEYSSITVVAGSTGPGPSPLSQPFIWTWVAILIVVVAIISISAIFISGYYTGTKPEILIILSTIAGIIAAVCVYLFWWWGI